ncbi:DUF192 domain-containing protein [Candidatus Giovannonibacteria bacterium]|nr:DUF192 domain-containing protein [Candidatus Giovannonibacteria bacterium]
MKYIILLLLLAAVTVSFIYFGRGRLQTEIKEITVDSYKLKVQVARSEADYEKGLQDVKDLGENEGMLFVFDKPRQALFWNKNTRIDLDVIWIQNGNVVGFGFLPKESSRKTYLTSPSPVDMVLEVNAGWAEQHDIKNGSTVVGY